MAKFKLAPVLIIGGAGVAAYWLYKSGKLGVPLSPAPLTNISTPLVQIAPAILPAVPVTTYAPAPFPASSVPATVEPPGRPSPDYAYVDGQWQSMTDQRALDTIKANMVAALLHNNRDMTQNEADEFVSKIDTVQQAVAIQAGLNQ